MRQVALALIIKRYSHPPATAASIPRSKKILRTVLICMLLVSAAMLATAYSVTTLIWPPVVAAGCHLVFTILLHVLVPQAPKPDYVAPFFPYVPSLSLLLNAWLCASLPGMAWIQYAIFLVIVAAMYFVYSVASSYALNEHSAGKRGGGALPGDAGKHGVVERTVSVISQTPSDLHLEQLGDGKDAGIQGKKAVELV